MRVKASLIENQRISSVAFISFHRRSCSVHFLSRSFHFAFIFLSCCINFLPFCFHVLSCSAAMYQRYRSSKADMLKPSQTGQVGIRPMLTFVLFFQLVFPFLVSFCYRFGALCSLSPSGFMKMYLYKLGVGVLLLSFSAPATRWQC